MGNRQQNEQDQQSQTKFGITHLSNDLLQAGNLKQQKQFGKRINVCYIPKNKVPLQLNYVNYDVQVNNGVATYNMSQSYKNHTNEPADVEFLFSVPPNCVIIKLEAQIGDKRVMALIKEKEEAQYEFEQGIQDGKTMLYSDQNEDYPDVIKTKIGNLGPQENILITYQYVEQLQVQVNEFWRLSIDPVVNPRYNQSQQNYLNNLFSVNQFNYNYVQDIKVTINMELEYIKSQTHQILVEKQDIGTVVKLNNDQQDNILKNQDPKNTFVLIFQNKNIHDPLILLTHTNNDQLQHQKYCATIQFIPQFNPLKLDDAYQAYQEENDDESNLFGFNAKGEYIFVIDRSGSMQGKRIEKAKQALKLFLQSLPVDSYYNIVSFGSKGKRQYKQSLKYNQSSLEQTLRELQQIEADMGGTEIRNCLQLDVLTIDRITGYTRNIFILTDGEVDPEPVLEVVSQNAKPDVRFYSLGIGNGCSQYMIEKIAFLGNGLHHIVADDEDLNQKVIDLLQDSITPYFEQFDFETNLPNQSLIVANVLNINCIKKNTPLTVQILFNESEIVEKQRYFFNLTYYDENLKQYGLHSEIDLNQSVENDNYHKLAVGKQFQQMLQYARLQQQEYKNIYPKDINISKQNILDLSLTYQILSPYTAFICEVVELQDDLKQKSREKVFIQIKKQILELRGGNEQLIRVKPLCLSMAMPPNMTNSKQMASLQPQMAIQKPQNNLMPQRNQVAKTIPFKQNYGSKDSSILLCSSLSVKNQSKVQSLDISNDCEQISQSSLQQQFVQQDKLQMNQQKDDKQNKDKEQKVKQINYLDIVDRFNLDGSIQEEIINLLFLKKEDFKLQLPFKLQLLIATLAILEIKYNEQKDSWILVFNKGVAHLKQNNIIYKQIKSEVIQMLKLGQ
ncbi:hypothetical protein pb186bvf_017876 [Paramecium bursaria]